jgi:hypothetical protein
MQLVQIIYQTLSQTSLSKLPKLFYMFIKKEKLKNSHSSEIFLQNIQIPLHL